MNPIFLFITAYLIIGHLAAISFIKHLKDDLKSKNKAMRIITYEVLALFAIPISILIIICIAAILYAWCLYKITEILCAIIMLNIKGIPKIIQETL